MKIIFLLVKKEFIELIRDKRTLFTMFLLPIILFPVIIAIVGFAMFYITKSDLDKKLNIAVYSTDKTNSFYTHLLANKEVAIKENIPTNKITELLKIDSIQAAITIPTNLDTLLLKNPTTTIQMEYVSTKEIINTRLDKILDSYKDTIYTQRLQKLGVQRNTLEPIKIEKKDTLTMTESIGKKVGGMIPYLFLITCFFTISYVGIDIISGEKERNTYETMLTLPISRTQLVTGKLATISLAGIIAGTLSSGSLFFGSYVLKFLPKSEELAFLGDLLNPVKFMAILLLIIPYCICMAGALVYLTVSAKTTKEAQSLSNPLSLFITLPIIIGMQQSLALSFKMACIPIINIMLCSREVLAGTIEWQYYGVTFCSLLLIAAIAVYFAGRKFADEKHILKL